jgi:hypothetical protein
LLDAATWGQLKLLMSLRSLACDILDLENSAVLRSSILLPYQAKFLLQNGTARSWIVGPRMKARMLDVGYVYLGVWAVVFAYSVD